MPQAEMLELYLAVPRIFSDSVRFIDGFRIGTPPIHIWDNKKFTRGCPLLSKKKDFVGNPGVHCY